MLDCDYSFLDEQQQKELRYLGYTIIKSFPKARLKKVKKETDDFIDEVKYQFVPKNELFNLINSTYIDTKLRSNSMVKEHLVSYLEETLDTQNITIIPVSHIYKPFGSKGSVWHHDSSVVDERTNFSLNVWMPLVNSTRLNGCLWMFPGSHINDNYFREFAYNYIVGDVYLEMRKHMIPLSVKAGEIVLFHRNIIHGSSNNMLPYGRTALEALIINKGAQMHVYRRDKKIIDKKVLDYKVDLKHYLDDDNMRNFYSGEYKYDLIDEEPFEVTQKRLLDSIPKFLEQAKKFSL